MPRFLLLLLLFATACSPSSPESDSSTITDQVAVSEVVEKKTALPPHQQILLSVTEDWNAVAGKVYQLEWQDDQYHILNPRGIDMVVGKNGLAWGRGLADYRDREGPVKREGDKKSPAGAFRLGTAFGYASEEEASFVKTDYTHVANSTMCIEDISSNFYNQIIDEGETPADWNSTDHMLRKDDLYEWGMFVLHNQPEPEGGSGSCIFLHVWRENDSGTAGCTAMDKGKMKELLGWFDPAKQPILIQLPQTAYGEFQAEFALPDLPI